MVESLDKSLLLWLNSMHTPFLDGLMWAFSRTDTWLIFFAVLLVVLMRGREKREQLYLLASIALLVLITDQFSAHVVKPLVLRLRPSHDPEIGPLVHLVRGYKGGLYGFFSSHAANTFGLATLLTLVLRQRTSTAILFLWASLCSYSRIYLGVHFPGDILCGALFGAATAYVIYSLMSRFATPSPLSGSQVALCVGFLLSFILALSRGVAFIL